MNADATIYVLAGVNGSGKSSIGGAAFTSRGVVFYNPDTVARRLCELHPNLTKNLANSHAWRLGREILEEPIARRKTYAFETTLGGRTITELLVQASRNGLKVKLWYVGLDSVERNISRVRARVARGGHPIPEADIRRRWNTSRRNLIDLLPSLSALRLHDNSPEANPHAGEPPLPRLLLHLGNGKIVGPDDLSRSAAWAKTIL